MKRKFITICTMLFAVAAIAGCSGNGKESSAPESRATSAPESQTQITDTSDAAKDSADTVETNATTAAGDESNALDKGTADSTQPLDARAYVDTLCNGDTDTLAEIYGHTEELMSALEAQGGFAGLQASLAQLGKLDKMGEPIVGKTGNFTTYSVPCQFEKQNINIVLNVDSDNKIAGIVTAQYDEGIKDAAVLPEGVTEQELNLPVAGHDGWELPGKLTLPEGDGPFPVVILVQGSGPSDMDETIGPNKPFRDLAYGLAKKGIAVYRYDKRTYVYGQESAADKTLTLNDETVNDAASALALLKEQDKLDASRIFVLGHSLGGQALPRIDAAITGGGDTAAGYIFFAAPARKLTELMREQYDFLYSLMPKLNEEQQAAKDEIYAALDQLADVNALADDAAVMGAYGAYWKDLDSYDQLKMAADIKQPCLVLQGEEDYQVTLEDFNLWKEAYEGAGNWEFKTYPGLTHLFMPGVKANAGAEYNKQQTVDAQVLADIAGFVNGK